jgi:predicted secreted hydrolase
MWKFKSIMNVNPEQGLCARGEDMPIDSWYFCGRVKSDDGQEYNWLIHHMIVDRGKSGGPQFGWQQIAVTNITKGTYNSHQGIYPLSKMSASKTSFDVRTPEGEMSGTMQDMVVKASTPKGGFDLILNTAGHVLFYNSGMFPYFDNTIWQYGLCKLETKGTVTVDGKTVKVSGTSYFDRQWDYGAPQYPFKWSWMQFNLDNGDVVCLWDMVETKASFATIVNPGGAITTVEMTPLAEDATDVWESPLSGRKFPTRWVVRFPAVDAVFNVEVAGPKDQEMMCAAAAQRADKKALNNLEYNYQAAINVKGTYQGKPVTGFGHMEHVGAW